jgi:hypothetical protein
MHEHRPEVGVRVAKPPSTPATRSAQPRQRGCGWRSPRQARPKAEQNKTRLAGRRFPSTQSSPSLVGDTGIEPVTSSVSTRSRSIGDVGVWLYALVNALVVLGLGGLLRRPFAGSSLRFLPSVGVDDLRGHPIAQATPGRAAPAWSGGAPYCLTDLDQAGAVWLPPGVR